MEWMNKRTVLLHNMVPVESWPYNEADIIRGWTVCEKSGLMFQCLASRGEWDWMPSTPPRCTCSGGRRWNVSRTEWFVATRCSIWGSMTGRKMLEARVSMTSWMVSTRTHTRTLFNCWPSADRPIGWCAKWPTCRHLHFSLLPFLYHYFLYTRNEWNWRVKLIT